ncbi:MAG: M24 family metallopeptidase [Nitrospiria bacterium]
MASQDGIRPANAQSNLLMIACSETDANIYYASRFLAPDPFIYLKANGKSYLLMSDLELDRARSQSSVDTVLSYAEYDARARAEGIKKPSIADVVHMLIKELGVDDWTVPDDFPLYYGDLLRNYGHRLSTKKGTYFENRMIKEDEEVAAISQVQEAVEEAIDEAFDMLRRAEIKEDLLYLDGGLLTSECMRKTLHIHLMEKGYLGQHTIIACGRDACDPHNEGSGPLRANESIIFDIFPRSIDSRYHADMSRTVVKGRPSDALKHLYDTVLEGQELGIQQIRSGKNGKEIHSDICRFFKKQGYQTGLIDGRMQGFFHGTGHGIGLDIHEPPRIGKVDHTLQAGEVVTVEPGLYYPHIGAVRIEDMVLVESEGGKNLTRYPKHFEIK